MENMMQYSYCGGVIDLYAIHSDWKATTDRYRQVIVLWTDNEPHPFQDASYQKNIYTTIQDNDPARYYPSSELPQDLAELRDWWKDPDLGYIDQQGKRLLLFSPLQVEGTSGLRNSYAWGEMRNWTNAIHRNVNSTGNLQELDYNSILETVVKAVFMSDTLRPLVIQNLTGSAEDCYAVGILQNFCYMSVFDGCSGLGCQLNSFHQMLIRVIPMRGLWLVSEQLL